MESDCNTFLTSGTAPTSLQTFSHLLPATKTCTSESIFDAALIAFKENVFYFELSCSANIKTDIKLL